MRLDKFLGEMDIGTRSSVKALLRQGVVTVNGRVVKAADTQIDELSDVISFKGQVLEYQKYVYYMMNKPEGVVSATADNTAPTVVSLLGSSHRDHIFPVGRLDKDTTGLLLLTNDGKLAHRLLSPKYHVDKTYEVKIAHSLTEEDIAALEQGLAIGGEHLTLPARVEVLEKNKIRLTIHEGKFHQVKRMLQAVNNAVLSLKRISFGCLTLDPNLAPGSYRELTPEELTLLCGKDPLLYRDDPFSEEMPSSLRKGNASLKK